MSLTKLILAGLLILGTNAAAREIHLSMSAQAGRYGLPDKMTGYYENGYYGYPTALESGGSAYYRESNDHFTLSVPAGARGLMGMAYAVTFFINSQIGLGFDFQYGLSMRSNAVNRDFAERLESGQYSSIPSDYRIESGRIREEMEVTSSHVGLRLVYRQALSPKFDLLLSMGAGVGDINVDVRQSREAVRLKYYQSNGNEVYSEDGYGGRSSALFIFPGLNTLPAAGVLYRVRPSLALNAGVEAPFSILRRGAEGSTAYGDDFRLEERLILLVPKAVLGITFVIP